jgi:hypothetical protein
MSDVRHLLDFVVLDALANDIEDLDGIQRLANHADIGWTAEAGGEIAIAPLLAALTRLIRDHLVRAHVESASVPELVPLPLGVLPDATQLPTAYFQVLPAGRALHAAWDPHSTEP